ncbi:MAG: autoinducer 2 ABC transporter substrate-binding protein [Acidobacteria bacterium]|nr:autoinducer 2 ABC transporter substrate-binding protein [Acidobacteriota bacterium]
MLRRMAVFALLGLTLSGCQRQKRGGQSLEVAFIPKLVGIPFFNSAKQGAEQAARELGVQMTYAGPPSADAALQVNVIQDMIAKQVDVLAVAANDPSALAPVLRRARKAGIKVITWDSDTLPDAREFFVNQVMDEQLGRHVMKLLAEQMGGRGEYAIITGALTASNLNNWMEWMKREQQEHYPEMKLVTVVACDDDQQKAFLEGQTLLQAYPNLKGIIGNSSAAPPGAAQAVQQAGKSGQVAIAGVSSPNLMRDYIKRGTARTITLWDPRRLGYLAMYMAVQFGHGKLPQDGQQVPSIGAVRFLNGVVIMGEPLDFTKDNVDKYDF